MIINIPSADLHLVPLGKEFLRTSFHSLDLEDLQDAHDHDPYLCALTIVVSEKKDRRFLFKSMDSAHDIIERLHNV